MKNDRRRCLQALAALPLAFALPVRAEEDDSALATVRRNGRLRVAVYNDFPPYSLAGKGIDVDLGQALAARLGLSAEIVGFTADENMGDDLRNMVWKGHYLGTRPADVMLHVPVDAYLQKENDKVRIFAPYHQETLAVAREPARIGHVAGSAAVALEVFTREKIGVETESMADTFLLSVLNGRLRGNVVHFRTVADAAAGLRRGEVAAVLATRAELEAAVQGESRFPVEAAQFPELRADHWALGMAVRAEAGDLAEALAKTLADLRRDGSLAAIFSRHGITYQPV
jgi:polar amino acid transport system substrate-binding protein